MSLDDQGRRDAQGRDTGIREADLEVLVSPFGNVPGLVQGYLTELGIS